MLHTFWYIMEIMSAFLLTFMFKCKARFMFHKEVMTFQQICTAHNLNQHRLR